MCRVPEQNWLPRSHAHALSLLAPPPPLQDKAQVLSDVRSIIAEQLGTDLEKASLVARCRRRRRSALRLPARAANQLLRRLPDQAAAAAPWRQ